MGTIIVTSDRTSRVTRRTSHMGFPNQRDITAQELSVHSCSSTTSSQAPEQCRAVTHLHGGDGGQMRTDHSECRRPAPELFIVPHALASAVPFDRQHRGRSRHNHPHSSHRGHVPPLAVPWGIVAPGRMGSRPDLSRQRMSAPYRMQRVHTSLTHRFIVPSQSHPPFKQKHIKM